MKIIKWLLDIANSKPLMFGLALLLIAVFGLTRVVVTLNRKNEDCDFEKTTMRLYYERKIDSILNANALSSKELNDKVEAKLNELITNYKDQLQEQKDVNKKVTTTITKTKDLIQKTNSQIENLKP